MDVIRYTPDAVGLAIALAHRTCKKGVSLFPQVGLEPRIPIFGAEDKVNKNVGYGLRHDSLSNATLLWILPQGGLAYQPRVQLWDSGGKRNAF